MNKGKELKIRGQDLALENAGPVWTAHALTLLRRYCRRGPGARRPLFAFEEFRMWALERGLPEPRSPNAWGALPRLGVRDGLMRSTPHFRPAMSRRTHAHPVRLWRAVKDAS